MLLRLLLWRVRLPSLRRRSLLRLLLHEWLQLLWRGRLLLLLLLRRLLPLLVRRVRLLLLLLLPGRLQCNAVSGDGWGVASKACA